MDFEKFINELRTKIEFKDTVDINDVVILVLKDVLVFGIVNDILKDYKKGDWWNISFTVFSIPLTQMTLTLRTPQMTGKEIFTINEENRFFAAVDIKKEIPKEDMPIKKVNPFKLVKK